MGLPGRAQCPGARTAPSGANAAAAPRHQMHLCSSGGRPAPAAHSHRFLHTVVPRAAAWSSQSTAAPSPSSSPIPRPSSMPPAAAASLSVDEASLFELPPSGLLHAVSALVRLAARDGGAVADALAELLPSSTWLLSLRAAAAQQLGSFGAPRLTALLAALGALPLQAEGSPLPVGFGTPRWALPRAVAAPEQWDQFLSAAVDAFADDLISRLDAAAGAEAAGLASGAAGAGGPPPAALVAPFAGALAVSKKWAMARVDDDYIASPECAERLNAFVEAHWPQLIANLAAIDASVDDSPVVPPPQENGAGEGEEEYGPASYEAKAGAARAGDGEDGLWRRYRRCELPPWQRYGGAAAASGEEEATGEEMAAAVVAAPAAVGDAVLPYTKRWRKRRAIAAFVARAQLQARLEPPEAPLRAFFEAAAPGLPAITPAPSEDTHETPAAEVLASNSNPVAATAPSYSLDDLESIVRTLLLLGRAPGEPWLRGLVGVIAARRADMGPQQMRGFLEGLRFFRTKSSSRQLRDTISILSEWL